MGCSDPARRAFHKCRREDLPSEDRREATLRADLPKEGLRVGICEKLVVPDPNNPSVGVAANVLIHDDQMIVNGSPQFCVPSSSASASRPWLTRVAALFRPSIATAQD